MVLGMPGFTRAGEARAEPMALAEHAKTMPLKILLMTGASLGNDLDMTLAEAHVLSPRIPLMSDPGLRRAINAGEVMYVDQHLSETVQRLRTRQLPGVDIAIIKAVAITESGGIVPTTLVGNSANFAIRADRVIVEINLNQSAQLEGLQDIYIPTCWPSRSPIPVVMPESRVGLPFIPIPPEKFATVVISNKMDRSSNVTEPDAETRQIAGHLSEFLKAEVACGRLPKTLHPLQPGIGGIGNARLYRQPVPRPDHV